MLGRMMTCNSCVSESALGEGDLGVCEVNKCMCLSEGVKQKDR